MNIKKNASIHDSQPSDGGTVELQTSQETAPAAATQDQSDQKEEVVQYDE